MLFHRQHGSLGDVREAVLSAKGVTPQFMSDVMAAFGARGNSVSHTSRVERLIEAQAWTDAALALVRLELPRWTVARLIFEEGEWHCALSKHCQLPEWLDDAVETRHEVLPLAFLAAFIEAREADIRSTANALRPVPQIKSHRAAPALCCENFS
jgi:hypothetical protein